MRWLFIDYTLEEIRLSNVEWSYPVVQRVIQILEQRRHENVNVNETSIEI